MGSLIRTIRRKQTTEEMLAFVREQRDKYFEAGIDKGISITVFRFTEEISKIKQLDGMTEDLYIQILETLGLDKVIAKVAAAQEEVENEA